MNRFLLTFLIVFTLSFSTVEKSDTDNEGFEPVAVLELFTSQGCSSCPAADALLDKVQKEYADENVFALSYHVAYWNYIGWKDPFSKEIYAEKQEKYARKFRNRNIYTPQLVINGSEHFVGSQEATMKSKLKSYLGKATSNEVKITSMTLRDGLVDFEYDIRGKLKGKSLRAVLVIKERETFVKRGENRNRKLKNTNIVVAETHIKLNGLTGKGRIGIPEAVTAEDEVSLILIAQDDDLSVAGAAKKKIVR